MTTLLKCILHLATVYGRELTCTSLQFTPTLHTEAYPAIDPSKTDLNLHGKVVIVTGASRGIGAKVRQENVYVSPEGAVSHDIGYRPNPCPSRRQGTRPCGYKRKQARVCEGRCGQH